MGQAVERKIPVEHQAFSFKSLPLKSKSTFHTPKGQSFFRMRFRSQNLSEIFERLFFKPCLLHVSHLGAPDSILPLPWLLCGAPGSSLQPQECCPGSGDCLTKYNLFVCLFSRPLVLVGPWCWWGWGLRWSLCPS